MEKRKLNGMWIPIVEYLVQQTVSAIEPDVDSNLPCSAYVVVENIHGGTQDECSFIDGLVFKKNVVRTSMLDRFKKSRHQSSKR